MGKIVGIMEEELDALREQASQAIPWQNEAQRLAAALRTVNPEHPAITNELWREHFASLKPRSFSPDPSTEAAIAAEAEQARIDAEAAALARRFDPNG